jgi:hypothetical protein
MPDHTPSTRILHCGKSIANYNLCVQEEVAGFTRRGPGKGDVVYLCVNHKGTPFCGVRMILGDETDKKPWPDADRYVASFVAEKIEFCEPFDLSTLREAGGTHWALKYLQGSKAIKDDAAIQLLAKNLSLYSRTTLADVAQGAGVDSSEVDEPFRELDKPETIEPGSVLVDRPEIMGTFQVVHFHNETDKIRGLEVLVNTNFYHLFPQYSEANSILIPKNRIFRTRMAKERDEFIPGVDGIPDGLLITFRNKEKTKLQINLLEYECFGEGKVRLSEKTKYLNQVIVPQLLRFASAFSCITDKTTRDRNIEDWVKRIIQYFEENEPIYQRMVRWVEEMSPGIRVHGITAFFQDQLYEAFERNIRVMLVIDELSLEQKETLKNVISAFRLPGGVPIGFESYVVKLVQRVNLLNHDHEYGLIFQG